MSLVADFFAEEKPEYVFLAAAKVGGIKANQDFPANFIYENLAIQNHVIHQSYRHQVKKLLFLGSSCIYPKLAPQPLKEEYLLSAPLEKTNEFYAIAKIAGIKLCESYRMQYGCNFIAVMPPNLYGISDHYDLEHAHVIPALIRKFHEAKINQDKEVILWGSGTPLREFMFADDLAEACIQIMLHINDISCMNAGTSEEISIADLAGLIKKIVAYPGEIKFDHNRPDGTPRKIMDSSLLKTLGFSPAVKLPEGLNMAYEDFKNNITRHSL